MNRQTISLNLSIWTRNFVRRMVSQTTRAAQRRAQLAGSTKDTAVLFVADTRPAMFLGVPHVLAMALLMVFGESMIFMGPIYSFWVVGLWVGARIAVRRDYNMPRICMLWLQTKAADLFVYLVARCFLVRGPTLEVWWGSSPTPFPIAVEAPRGIWR